MRYLPLFGLLLLAGCGGEPARTPAGPPTSAPDAHLVAALGDSITAGSPLWDPDPAVRAQLAAQVGEAPDEESQWGFWFERANPGRTVRNCGVFGERTDEIATRLAQCGRGARAMTIQGGINDIAQGRDVADAARDLDAMVLAAQRDHPVVALVEVLPWNNGYPDAASQIDGLNRRIREIGSRRGVPVLPWFEALEDPAAPGRMRKDLTIDGDHPSVKGYKRLAALVELP